MSEKQPQAPTQQPQDLERLARRGQEIERKPYLKSSQEDGPNLDPDLPETPPAPGSTMGTERSGGQ